MEVGNEYTEPIDLNLLEPNLLSVKYSHGYAYYMHHDEGRCSTFN